MSELAGTIDFFISYRGAQGGWARWVNWVVRTAGYSTVLMDEFKVGTTWTGNMRDAARDCRRLIPLYSVDYWDSGACIEEFDAFWRHHLKDGKARCLLPLEIEACTVPDMHAMLLSSRVHILDRDAARAAILAVLEGIDPVTSSNSIPIAAEPPFPPTAAADFLAASAPLVWPPRCIDFVPNMANREAEFSFFADSLCGTVPQRGTLISAETDHGKTKLVSEFYRYGCEVLGEEGCCLVDFKGRGTVENLLDTIACDLGGRVSGLGERSPSRLRDCLRKANRPVLFVFDTFERATEEAREFVETHFLSEMGRAGAMRVLLAGQPKEVPDPTKATWSDYARKFDLNSIADPKPWVEWAARVFPLLPSAAVSAIAVSAGGAPGAIANQLTTLGNFNPEQLAAFGIQ